MNSRMVETYIRVMVKKDGSTWTVWSEQVDCSSTELAIKRARVIAKKEKRDKGNEAVYIVHGYVVKAYENIVIEIIKEGA